MRRRSLRLRFPLPGAPAAPGACRDVGGSACNPPTVPTSANRYLPGPTLRSVGSRHVGDVLSLVRQGLTLGVQFGTHSVEALLWVAETVEEGVYEAGSLRRTAEGISFALDNPPLRVGAFTSLRVRVGEAEVTGDRIRIRPGPGTAWRTAASVGPDAPFHLGPGDRSEFDLVGEFGSVRESVTVRIELRTPAVPPLVWFEFAEPIGEGGSGP